MGDEPASKKKSEEAGMLSSPFSRSCLVSSTIAPFVRVHLPNSNEWLLCAITLKLLCL